MHRVGGGRRELRDGVVLADDVGPHVDAEGRGRHRRIIAPRRSDEVGEADATRSSQIAAATSSGVWVPSSTAQRSGSAMACCEEAVVDPPVEVASPAASSRSRAPPVRSARRPTAAPRAARRGRATGPSVAHAGERGDLRRRELAAVALVGDRRAGEAVGDDRAAGGEGRPDHLGDVLGPVGGHEQRLGPRGDLEGGAGRAASAPDRGAERRVARLEGEQRAEALGEAGGPGWTCRSPRRPRRR